MNSFEQLFPRPKKSSATASRFPVPSSFPFHIEETSFSKLENHLLSKGLDSGPMLYHAMSNLKTNPFEYTMSTIKSAFHSIAERIKDNSIFKINPVTQDKIKEIRYSKKNEFNEEIVKEYFKKKINLNNKKFDNSLLKEPFFLNN